MIVIEDKERSKNRYFTDSDFILFMRAIRDEKGDNCVLNTLEQAYKYLSDNCHYEYELKSKI